MLFIIDTEEPKSSDLHPHRRRKRQEAHWLDSSTNEESIENVGYSCSSVLSLFFINPRKLLLWHFASFYFLIHSFTYSTHIHSCVIRYVSDTASPATKAIALHYLLRDREIQQARIARAYATLTPFILSCVLWIKERTRYFAIVTIQAHARGIYVRKDLDSLVNYLLFRKSQRKLACLMIRNWIRKRAEAVSNRRHKFQLDRLRRRSNPSFLASIPEEPEYTNNKTKQSQSQPRHIVATSPASQTSVSRPESPSRSSQTKDVPLPPTWQTFMDTKSGRPYYYNSLTGVTQWQHPVVTPLVGSSTTTNNHPQNSNNPPSDISFHGDDRHRQNVNHPSSTVSANPSNHSTPVKKNIGEHLNAIFGGLLRRSASASTSPIPNNQRTSYPPSSTITANNGAGVGSPMSGLSVSMKETVSHIPSENNPRNTQSAHGAIAGMDQLHAPNSQQTSQQNLIQSHDQGLSPGTGAGLVSSSTWEVQGKARETHVSSEDENNKNSNPNAMMLLQQRGTENHGQGIDNEQEQGLLPSTLSPLTIPPLSPSRKHLHPGDGDEAVPVTTNTRPKSADLPKSPITSSSLHDTSSPKVLSRHFSWTSHINNTKGSVTDPINIVPRHQLKAALARTLLGGSSDCLDAVSPRPGR